MLALCLMLFSDLLCSGINRLVPSHCVLSYNIEHYNRDTQVHNLENQIMELFIYKEKLANPQKF